AASGHDPAFDAVVAQLRAHLGTGSADEFGARMLVERLALALQAAVLLNSQSPAAGLFVSSRLQGKHGLAFGTLRAKDDIDELIKRALP
ncbi:MAG: DNA alkylation response protein, partial [Pseudoxanthomonas sp.]